MPRFDGSGPLGLGPGTGRGLGPCSAGLGWRRGFGRGFGWRRFWGYLRRSPMSKKEEVEMLTDEAAVLEDELKAIKERLNELRTKK